MQLIDPADYRHVNYLWDDAHAATLDEVDRLVYRSNLLGSDQRITNTGGGNTSSKIWQVDPLTGADVDVMFVKGSGGDLRTAKRENFASLYMDKLMQLQSVYNAAREQGRQDTDRRRDGRHVSALRLQLESARQLNRYAAARLHPVPPCRSHPPQRRHRHRRIQQW